MFLLECLCAVVIPTNMGQYSRPWLYETAVSINYFYQIVIRMWSPWAFFACGMYRPRPFPGDEIWGWNCSHDVCTLYIYFPPVPFGLHSAHVNNILPKKPFLLQRAYIPSSPVANALQDQNLSTMSDPAPPTTASPTTTTTTDPKHSRIQAINRNLHYLYDPKAPSTAPTKFRTRAFLRTTRYILVFIFWRLYRYAKYAAVGALTAAVAGTAFGTLTGGIGFLLAPTGILGGAGVGLVWGAARMGWAGWRMLGRRVRSGDVGRRSARLDEEEAVGMSRSERREREGLERGLRAEPW